MSKIRCIRDCTVPRDGHRVFIGKGMLIENIYEADEPCLKHFVDEKGKPFNPPYRPPVKPKSKLEEALEKERKELHEKAERLEALEARLLAKLGEEPEKPAKGKKPAKDDLGI